jgi:hypothetical protein
MPDYAANQGRKTTEPLPVLRARCSVPPSDGAELGQRRGHLALGRKVPADRSLQVGIRIYCSAVIRLLASEPPVDHEIDHFAQEVECG